MIIDAHQHFWDPQRFRYPWMTAEVEPLRRSFLPADLQPILAAAGVGRTVVVQAAHSLDESRWLLDLAGATEFVAGAVVWADLASPELGRQLDEFQRRPKFRGVRHQVHDEADEAWMLRADVVGGLRELERRSIPYDLLLRPRHLRYVAQVRERCPALRLVIDHLAKPPIASKSLERWATDMESVASLPGVWCKLSGMVTEADWGGWTAADFEPYVDHVVRHFGYDHVMFGSDWPVATLAASYPRVVGALREALGPLDPAEAAKVWGENARTFYQLD